MIWKSETFFYNPVCLPDHVQTGRLQLDVVKLTVGTQSRSKSRDQNSEPKFEIQFWKSCFIIVTI